MSVDHIFSNAAYQHACEGRTLDTSSCTARTMNTDLSIVNPNCNLDKGEKKIGNFP